MLHLWSALTDDAKGWILVVGGIICYSILRFTYLSYKLFQLRKQDVERARIVEQARHAGLYYTEGDRTFRIRASNDEAVVAMLIYASSTRKPLSEHPGLRLYGDRPRRKRKPWESNPDAWKKGKGD